MSITKLFGVLFVAIVGLDTGLSKSSPCGIDNTELNIVYEGLATIESYPWLGVLSYPISRQKYLTTAVVLVTRQIVLGAASEIDALPKADFRKRSKVILGRNCSGPSIGVRDYSFHPDYSNNTYSALAMIQLELDHVKIEMRPICPPPPYFKNPKFYAMVLSDDCKESKVSIYKMQYVPMEECHAFYRRTGLDVDSMWPSHTACAKSVMKGHCVWRSGAILVVKQGQQWRLLGFGVYGPGCEAPARFLDYGMYHKWVRTSISRIGRPAITKMGANHIVMRRTFQNVQRFGPCDPEEMKFEIYKDITMIKRDTPPHTRAVYNVSLYSNVEYSCIVFKAEYLDVYKLDTPQIYLRRWCAGAASLCFGFQFLEIHFHIEILFNSYVLYSVIAYGREKVVIDVTLAMRYLNAHYELPHIGTYNDTKEDLKTYKPDRSSFWFFNEDH